MCNDNMKFLKRKFKSMVRCYVDSKYDDVDKVIEIFKELHLPKFEKFSDEDFKEISNEIKADRFY